MRCLAFTTAIAVFCLARIAGRDAFATEPILSRVPGGGIQPQAFVSSDGTTHMIYYKGDPKTGDVFYVRRRNGESTFSEPLQVNSVRGSAVAIGTIRGAQLAMGRSNRIHVAWNGSGNTTSPGMRYTRLNDRGDAFEPERNVMHKTSGLDGGGSVAADSAGDVYVVWHGQENAETRGETNRAVYVAISRDDGQTFSPERTALSQRLGACACCGLKAFAPRERELYVLYRAAITEGERDETLLHSSDAGETFQLSFSHPWRLNTCPMSSAWIGADSKNQIIAGWETKGRAWFMNISPTAKDAQPYSVSLAGGQKHPVAAVNSHEERLLVWTEGTGWQRGGAVAWQLTDSEGHAVGKSGRKDGVPIWSFAAAVCRADGTFEIFY